MSLTIRLNRIHYSITQRTGDSMKIGNMYRVCKKGTHKPCHYDNLVIVTGRAGQNTDDLGKYKVVVATNLKTGEVHHYFVEELEAL